MTRSGSNGTSSWFTWLGSRPNEPWVIVKQTCRSTATQILPPPLGPGIVGGVFLFFGHVCQLLFVDHHWCASCSLLGLNILSFSGARVTQLPRCEEDIMLRVCSMSGYGKHNAIMIGSAGAVKTIWAYVHMGSWSVYGSISRPGRVGRVAGQRYLTTL